MSNARLRRPIGSLAIGDAFAVWDRRESLGYTLHANSAEKGLRNPMRTVVKLCTVILRDGEHSFAKCEDGNVLNFRDRYNETTSGDTKIAWTDHLPNGTPAEQKAYAELLLADRGYMLALIEAVHADGTADAAFCYASSEIDSDDNIVTDLTPDDDIIVTDLAPDDDRPGYDAVGRASFWQAKTRLAKHERFEWRAGDLIGGLALDAYYEDETLVCAIAHPRLIAPLGSREAVGAFMPDGIISKQWHSSPHYLLEEAADLAFASTQPNEALVLYWRETGSSGRRDDTGCYVLGTMGRTFHRADSVVDYFDGADVEPGLWIMEGATWWASTDYWSGEHDAGIDGDWRPATLEDLDRWGLTLDCLDKEIADITDRPLEAGTGLAAIEAAGIAGKRPSNEDIADRVTAWHEGRWTGRQYQNEVYHALGWTSAEYARWVSDPSVVPWRPLPPLEKTADAA